MRFLDGVTPTLIAAEKSRPVLWDMSTGLHVLWYTLAVASVLVFLYGCARPWLRYRRGNRDGLPPKKEIPGRFMGALRIAAAQTNVARRNAVAGWAHGAIFYGWLTLFAGTVIVGIDTDVTGAIFGFHFFKGDFYLACKAALNLLGTALIVGLLVMMVRRVTMPDKRYEYDADPARSASAERRDRYRAGDWVAVGTLLLIAITGFVIQGLRIAMEDPGYGAYQFGGLVVAEVIAPLHLGEGTLAALRHGLWWFHGLLAITFVAAIPFTKVGHMFYSFISLVLKDPDAGRRLPPVPAERRSEPIGYAKIADFSSLHLLQLDACTRCGRCHEVCPARTTGRPLSPREVVLNLQAQAREENPAVGGVLGGLLAARGGDTSVVGGDGVSSDSLWACMQCNACVAVCPVGIEQAPIINQMRRAQVEEGEIDSSLQTVLESIGEHGNSFGQAAETRADWTKGLDFEIKDARKEAVEVLWFVGDYASFDEGSLEVTRATARLFQHAGLDFGILYEAEWNSGNDVRHVGEEGLFESLARHNIETLADCTFDRIVTTDPHSLNALLNEYAGLGADWEVLHHTQELLRLIEAGRLDVRDRLDHRVTYHDPCHLGRLNGAYDAPRRILELLGCELLEMPRNRENSFCCGAGGGRIWMPDSSGTEKASENRIGEAVSLGELDFFVVTCPKDVTMYEDAIRTSGNSDRLALREVTVLIEEALTKAGASKAATA